jgi:hypothetical protein
LLRRHGNTGAILLLTTPLQLPASSAVLPQLMHPACMDQDGNPSNFSE